LLAVSLPVQAAKVGDVGGFQWVCLSKSVLIDITNAAKESDEAATKILQAMLERGICGAFDRPYPFALLELIATVETKERTTEIWRITNGRQQAFGVVHIKTDISI